MPCLNEERNLVAVLDGLPDSVTEVVIVDGESTDGTMEVARKHRPDSVLISQHAPGKGAASVAGLLASTGEIVVLIDADCSMAVADIDKFVARLLAGADVVHGSRNLPGGGSADFTRVRAAGNTVLTWIANVFYGVNWSDVTFGYLAIWRDVITTLRLAELLESPAHPLRRPDSGTRYRPTAYGHGFEVEVLLLCRAARAGLTIEEVPSYEMRRRYGTSSLNAFRDGLRVANAVWRERVTPAGRYRTDLQRTAPMNRRLSRNPLDAKPPTSLIPETDG
jgi:glycosyltransferase involved in cell wall biosynthesis